MANSQLISHHASQQLAKCPPVGQLCKYQRPAHQSTTCLEILELFLEDADMLAIPVVDGSGIPVALINRQVFVEFFTRQYVREIHGRKTIQAFLTQKSDSFPRMQPIIVDESAAIDDVAQMIIGAGMQHMVTGFVVTRNKTYLGIADGHDLLNEITQRKQSDLYFLAHFDQLTGLPNRMLFADRLAQACRDSERTGNKVGVMFVDVDRFKQVNDSMGHGFGDLLLGNIAERLSGCARESDTVARLGGDEFAILMDNLKGDDSPKIVAQRIINTMKAPMVIADRAISTTVSIGIAVYPSDDRDMTTLLGKADAAMYEAKRQGRNGYRLYAPGLSMTDPDQIMLEADLRYAIANGEFLIHYQPKVNLSDSTVIGVEALVRWQHPTRGLISPAYFIPLAEETGMITDLGTWVLRQACIQHCVWRDAGLPPVCIAVNIAPLQFRQENFVDVVRGIVTETGIDPHFLELEMTEGTVMLNAAGVQETLKMLKTIGVRLAIDDFGTGYSNLNYLKNFPIDTIKIDQSFVRGIDTSAVNESIVRAVVAMANCLSVETVAEGAESQAELDIVKNCLCDSAQGYHFAKPMPPGEFVEWFRDFQRSSSSVQPGVIDNDQPHGIARDEPAFQ